ncbi:citrate lyase holo-[acyl-carrier protein] synthase [uncultured Cohaesibacter sp.]|uniref:citrate lyase holo-[acyl-carrier protein] synthase n=1 Tax=uncultured Cohaesibacter sp. TaxID=1002546 RepID=UPI0029C781BF|nr:citrate lyase holo-[acyl-carrier protein] synthase [uncultured Cohaesibacter sp.]
MVDLEGWLVGDEVALPAMLAAREARVRRREDGLAHYRQPTLTLSVVMPGPVKLCPLTSLLFEEALKAVPQAFAARGIAFEKLWSGSPATGPEALFSVDTDGEDLKRAMVALEETHPLGRLWDLDVHGSDSRSISRRDLGLAPRRCLICEEAAHACARSRRHGLEDVWATMVRFVSVWQEEAEKGANFSS